MMKNLLVFIFTFLSFSIFAQAPNFVFILADDMGWTGTSVEVSPTVMNSGSDFYETPRIQQLANEGMTFSQAYAPAAKCSPSRASILTGQTTARNSFTETGNGATPNNILIAPMTETTIPTVDTTIAEWLHLTGENYRTAHLGKWHLGSGGTTGNGFDEGDGNTNNDAGDAADGLIIQNDPKKIFDLTNRGIAFMQDAVNNNQPFYLQLSHYAVHGGIETTQSSFDYFDAKPPGAEHDNVPYAGMTKDLDDAVGIILDEIDNLGISGNTYVIFLSDNGGPLGMTSNTPLRRGKSFIYEGGIRVPMIVRGPNIPSGVYNSEPVVGYDLFPTIAEWTNNSEPLPNTLDGRSIVPLLNQQTLDREEPLYFHIPHYNANNQSQSPRSAAIKGRFKLIVEYETGNDFLYDLDTDIEEVNNVATTYPDVFRDLKIQLRDHLKSVNANMPTLDPTNALFSGSGSDIDNDGLDDEWEFRELLSYVQIATDDPDGDGADNLTEYNNGTDPLVSDLVNTEDLVQNKMSLKVFPNPTDGILNLKLESSFLDNEMVDIQLFNTTGQLINSFQKENNNLITVNLQNMQNGVYWIRLSHEGKPVITQRFIFRDF